MKKLCQTTEIAPGKMKGFDVEGRHVLVLNIGGEFKACDGVCPHQEVMLAEGIFDGTLLTCHSHLWQWNVREEEIEREAEEDLVYFQLHVDGGEIWLVLDESGKPKVRQ